MAVFFFFAGVLLALWSGARIVIRAFKFMQARGYGSGNWDIAPIRLKDTFVLDVFGWIAGLTMVIGAIQFM